MKNNIDTSRKKTPWDNTENITSVQSFIKEKYQENFNSKHPRLIDTNESDLFNSIKIETCPYCECKEFIKYGKTSNKIQRYLCNGCNSTFTPITGTIFDEHKIPVTEWIEFCLDLLNYGSITFISKINKNGVNTSIYWLHKLFLILEEYQNDIVLKGNVYIDETFYSVIYRDRIQENGKFLRGLSENQFCIGIGCDGNNLIARVEGMGKTSKERTKTTFINHIEPGSTLIHDDEKSHKVLVNELKLVDKSYNSKDLKKLTDKENPLDKINNQCDLLKKFLYSHSGFDRKDLQNYLNFFCFMNSKPLNKLKKVEKLLELALTTRITLKYRDLFKNDKSN